MRFLFWQSDMNIKHKILYVRADQFWILFLTEPPFFHPLFIFGQNRYFGQMCVRAEGVKNSRLSSSMTSFISHFYFSSNFLKTLVFLEMDQTATNNTDFQFTGGFFTGKIVRVL